MKKKVFIVLSVVVVLAAAYIIFNRFDIPKQPLEYTIEELRGNPSFDWDNGYYRLWSLGEAPSADIESPDFLLKYRRLFDPQYDNDKYIKEWDQETYKKSNVKNWGTKFDAFKPYNLPYGSIKDSAQHYLEHKEHVVKLQSEIEILMNRYQKLIDCERFEDFTLFRIDSPIPNLLIWLNAAKQYNRFYLLQAMDGEWLQGAAKLLDQIRFGKKANKGSVVLITNLVAKGVVRITLRGLSSLMNRKDCPKEVYEQVLNNLPELEYKEYGSWPLAGEYLYQPIDSWDSLAGYYKMGFWEKKLLYFFTQPNRTNKYKNDHMVKVIECDRTPPYKWTSDPRETKDVKSGWFWWLRNPGGKIIYEKYLKGDAESIAKVVQRTYAAKTVYDMVKISAGLHLNYTPDKPVQEILNGLETYKALLDPCSGKPYRWNDEKQVLYSIGVDRKDDGGNQDHNKFEGDFVLPVILYLK
ncbi:MAG: hypothetical protein KAW12_26965 [Candidatus Aminicenantes bacterium]|nr:hypothetical protein [Candidatus Aminicenantes bacterium]